MTMQIARKTVTEYPGDNEAGCLPLDLGPRIIPLGVTSGARITAALVPQIIARLSGTKQCKAKGSLCPYVSATHRQTTITGLCLECRDELE
jgi:hypothetical protein